ncbi:MAG: hypothetical protein AAFX04_02330 [Pseudomonadota bacterium]
MLSDAGRWGCATWGAISGVFELGFFLITAALLASPNSLTGGAWAGLGAAIAELAYLLAMGIWYPDDDQEARIAAWQRGARRSAWVRNIFLVERSSASLIHIGTRMLATLALISHTIWPLLIALASFTLVDGVATYGVKAKWNWFNPILCRAFYKFVFLCGLMNFLAVAALSLSALPGLA